MTAILRRLAVVVVVVLVARAAGGAVAVILALGALGTAGLIAARRFPRRNCLECGGRGRFYSKMFPWWFRLCSNCTGNGRVLHEWVPIVGSAALREQARRERAARKHTSRFRER
jgi:hypothetical protein